MAKLFLLCSTLSGFLAVALGAFGAHGLKNKLSDYHLGVYQTAVEYQFYHAFALMGLALWMMHNEQMSVLVKTSGFAFVFGSLIFCGSLYLLALTGIKWLGAITPIGGVLWLVAWLCFAIAVFKTQMQ